jgi:hypothetical protein
VLTEEKAFVAYFASYVEQLKKEPETLFEACMIVLTKIGGEISGIKENI